MLLKLLNILGVEGIELFVIFSKENKSVCKKGIFEWMHMHSFIHEFHVETVCRSVERTGELHAKDYEMQSQRLTQYKTQWSVRIFESWKKERRSDEAATESNYCELDVSVVKLLYKSTRVQALYCQAV